MMRSISVHSGVKFKTRLRGCIRHEIGGSRLFSAKRLTCAAGYAAADRESRAPNSRDRFRVERRRFAGRLE